MRKAALILSWLLYCCDAWAQAPVTGFPAFGSFQPGGFDTVNRQNLNVIFQIPVVSTPGRGLPFTALLAYNSLIWQKSGTLWTPVVDGQGAPTWGWQRTTPTMGPTTYTTSTWWCKDDDSDWWPIIEYKNYTYRDQAGTPHPFGLDIMVGPPEGEGPGCEQPPDPQTGYATDSSGYYIDATDPSNPKVFAPAGFNFLLQGPMKDSNGNYISKTVVSSTETHWIDTLGRTALKIINTGNPIYKTEYKYQDSGGVEKTVTMNLASTPVKTNFGCSGVTEYTATVYLPTSVVLPNGTQYTFTYEDTPGFTGYVTGRIKRVTLPTGGYYEYSYPGANDGINCADGTVKNLTRVVNDGTSATWTYARAPSGSNWNTTVTAPQLPYDAAANQSVFTFNSSGQLTAQKFYQGAATGTPLRTIDTTWAANGTPSSTKTTLENNQQSKVDTTFDATYGNLTQIIEYDWGSGAPGAAKRTTSITYLLTSDYISRNILDRVTQVLVRDGGPTGTIKSRTAVAYDVPTPTCVSGAAHHDDSGFGCSFNTRGNPTSVTRYTNAAAQSGPIPKNFTYDTLGNVLTGQLNCCQLKQWNYSSTTEWAYPDSIVSGSGGTQLTTTTTYNFSTGSVATSTDENGRVTQFTYDLLGRPTSVLRPDNATISYSYNDGANSTATVSVPVSGTSDLVRTTYFDGLGRAFKQAVSDGSTTYSISESQYDPLGRAYKAATPHNSTAQYWTETRYDALGRVLKVIPPDGSPSSNNTSYSYSGNTVTVTDPAAKQIKYQNDGLGRLAITYEPDVANGNQLTQQTSYAYNVVDALLTVTQGSQSRTYVYDDAGRLTSAATPEAGMAAISYQYNSFDQVTQRTDARGVITTYTYDTLNRPYQVSYNVGSTGVPATPTVTYTYGTNPSSYNNGRLLTVADGSNTETYSCDVLGQVTQVQKLINGATYTVGYAYNLAGEVTSITYPSGRIVQQNYDAIGRLTTILSGATNYASGYSYNPAGQVTGFTYGNTVTAAFGYTPERLLLQTVSYTKPGQTLLSLSYGYTHPNLGKNGQVTQITDNIESGRSATYTYDALYRVSTAVTTGSGSYPAWGLQWTYDRYGNRTNQTVTAGSAPSNSLSISATTNRITSSLFTYDANGNLTQEGSTSLQYKYDAENRLVSFNNGADTYTYLGAQRVQKVYGGTTAVYVFSGSKMIAVYANGAPNGEYVYAGNTLLAGLATNGTPFYRHPDHLTQRMITNPSQGVEWVAGHYPFGENWYQPIGNDRWRFTSYDRDSESGNDYAIFRYYQNRLGRFSSPDPLAGSVAVPQSLNRYAYVWNDPVNLVDPLGLNIVPCPLGTAEGTICVDVNGGGGGGGEGGDNGFPTALLGMYLDFLFGSIHSSGGIGTGGASQGAIEKAVEHAKKQLRTSCNLKPDVVTAGAGADFAFGGGTGVQGGIAANGTSGELSATLTFNLNLGVEAGVYLFAGLVGVAENNQLLNTPNNVPTQTVSAGVGQFGGSVNPQTGDMQVTTGPSIQYSGMLQTSTTRVLATVPYLGYVLNPKGLCTAVFGQP